MAIFRRLATFVLAVVTAGHVLAQDMAPAFGTEAPPFSGINRPFVFTEPRIPVPDLTVIGPDGAEMPLSALKGRVVLLNLWATWCPPCVKEMPSLDRLQAALGSDRFTVVALSLDRGGKAQVEPFFMETGLEHLAIYLDPKMTAMKAFKPQGLPTTLLIDTQGREIGRLAGEAVWDSAEAMGFLRYFIDGGQ